MTTFYDVHAADFSKSRFRIWPHVKNFLDVLSTNSRVLDIGCGNGKNMNYGIKSKELQMVGLEHSRALTDICLTQGFQVVQGAAQSLPFEDNSFDAIIMIAVIHHIDPIEHIKVLNEIKRVLKPNGTCLITNWAVEQPENAKRQFHNGLNWVIWKGKEDNPLPYWVMGKCEALEFIDNIPDNLQNLSLVWDVGNWNILLTKVSKTL